MTQNNAQTTLGYLKLTDSSRHFPSYILKKNIEDRRIIHAERINDMLNLVILKSSDTVMNRTVVQIDKS